MALRKGERPTLWIVAGPNGSGKSTLYESSLVEGFGRAIWIINPDILAARIADQEHREPTAANVEALIRIKAWLESSIRAHQTIGVETVLSTPKYRNLVSLARSFGFSFNIIYVVLQTAALNIERVRDRVADGGHAVPEEKIIERRSRSLAELPWFLANADEAWIFDNSAEELKLWVHKRGDLYELDEDAISEITEAVSSARQIEGSALAVKPT